MQPKGTLGSLLWHHNSKASILQCSAFFRVQLSHPNMTTGKTIILTVQTFVGKVMSLLFNMLSRFITAFLPRSNHLLISWLQSSSTVILEPKKIKSLLRSGGKLVGRVGREGRESWALGHKGESPDPLDGVRSHPDHGPSLSVMKGHLRALHRG